MWLRSWTEVRGERFCPAAMYPASEGVMNRIYQDGTDRGLVEIPQVFNKHEGNVILRRKEEWH
jgi:hypothetical protein